MKAKLLILSLLFLSSVTFGQKSTLGIMDFSTGKGISADDAHVFTELVFGAVYQYVNDLFDVIDIERRDELLDEQKFALSGLIDDVSSAVEVGKYLAAEYLIVGRVSMLDGIYFVTMKIVNVNTTRVFGTSMFDSSNYSRLAEGIEPGIRELFSDIVATSLSEAIDQHDSNALRLERDNESEWVSIKTAPTPWFDFGKTWEGPAGVTMRYETVGAYSYPSEDVRCRFSGWSAALLVSRAGTTNDFIFIDSIHQMHNRYFYFRGRFIADAYIFPYKNERDLVRIEGKGVLLVRIVDSQTIRAIPIIEEFDLQEFSTGNKLLVFKALTDYMDKQPIARNGYYHPDDFADMTWMELTEPVLW